MNTYALIMAGGQGTRLWPQSRVHTPKQLWEIVQGRSILQDTVARIAPLIAPDQVMVITGAGLFQPICDQLPQVPVCNILREPVGRNTAPCVGLAALYIDDPDACMVVLPSDHIILNQPEFRRVLAAALQLAAAGENLVTFGIKPTHPETGFGYIQRGQAVQPEIYKVLNFMEKPDHETAQRFLASGEYYWNSGMFVWKVRTLLTMIERHLPHLHRGLMRIKAAIGSAEEARIIAEVFPELQSVSIDYGIMEKADATYVVPGDFGWNDVGSWAALEEVWEANQDHNTCKGQVVALDSYHNIAYSSDGLIALIGVENLVVVRTAQAVLVCAKDQAQRVKDLVEKLGQEGLTEYL